MPVKISSKLPAYKHLISENIFVMSAARAESQDIRPLKIAILNLMPNKEITETQLLRLIGNTPLQIEVTLVHTASYFAKNTPAEHLKSFYRTFEEIKDSKFDGLIITGAPVEKLEFEDVAYWNELVTVLDWAKHNVYSIFCICWAAQAALYHLYGVGKYELPDKLSGIYQHRTLNNRCPLTFGFDDTFLAPHSRYTAVDRAAVLACPSLEILAESAEAGVYIAASKDLRQVFVTGHGEYDSRTLHDEYLRDRDKGLACNPPVNYYPDNDPNSTPPLAWRGHASLLFSNWINTVYQGTPYDFCFATLR